MTHLICPKCYREYVMRVSRRGWKERLLGIFYVYPFRCQLCGYRFRFLQWGVRYRRVEGDRREYERLPMNFPVSFVGENIQGAGTVLEISMSGCTFRVLKQPPEGIVRLALQISNELNPIEVEAALVRNVRQDYVGVEFLRFQPTERERLQLFIRGLLLGRRTQTVGYGNHDTVDLETADSFPGHGWTETVSPHRGPR